jgi:hypothetical protein
MFETARIDATQRGMDRTLPSLSTKAGTTVLPGQLCELDLLVG